MNRPRPSILAAAVALCLVLPPAAAPADVVVLKNGTRLEGDLERTADGYNVTAADGAVAKVKAAQIRSVEVRTPAAPDDAARRLASLRRAAENMSDAKIVAARYGEFLRQFGDTPEGAEARQDVATWHDRVDRHMTKVAGKWVTPEELGALQEQSQQAAAKARYLVPPGRLREAAPLLQQALDVDAKNASALYLRGVVLCRQEQLGPARKAFDAVAQLVPDHAPTLNNLAVILWRQEQVPGALRFFNAALLAAGPEAGGGGRVAEAVVNNVAEALHAMPKEKRDDPATRRVVATFQERETALVEKMRRRGLYRWGATWVDGAKMDQLQAKEKEIEDKVADIQADFDATQDRIALVDRDIQDTERVLRRMETESYARDASGRPLRVQPPGRFFALQRDLQDLKRERADQEARLNSLRREAKAVRQELPVPRYSGTQKLIDVEGTPLMPAEGRAEPAGGTAGVEAQGAAGAGATKVQ